jgi:hypothetical protein
VQTNIIKPTRSTACDGSCEFVCRPATSRLKYERFQTLYSLCCLDERLQTDDHSLRRRPTSCFYRANLFALQAATLRCTLALRLFSLSNSALTSLPPTYSASLHSITIPPLASPTSLSPCGALLLPRVDACRHRLSISMHVMRSIHCGSVHLSFGIRQNIL